MLIHVHKDDVLKLMDTFGYSCFMGGCTGKGRFTLVGAGEKFYLADAEGEKLLAPILDKEAEDWVSSYDYS